MKKIFKYFVVILSAALATACFPEEVLEDAEVGLGIKTFFPTKVVSGLEMTINGSGFTNLTEIVFPGKAADAETAAEPVSVTTFKVVTDNMVRVTVPKNVGAGKIAVKTESDSAESRLEITVGDTQITGYSKQEGEEINGGEQLTIYGSDLEFISSVTLQFEVEGEAQSYVIKDTDFYRKGTSSVVIALPKKMTEKKAVISGKVKTIDGLEFDIPTLNYSPASDGGHWEVVKEVIWTNELGKAVAWSGDYRFALEGHDGNNECIAEFPQDVWDRLKTETFYLKVEATDPQVRVTTGWWDPSWSVGDIQPGNERIVDNGDGTWIVTINISEDETFVAALDDRHLLFTGDRYTPVELYFEKEEWVAGGGHLEIVDVPFWTNELGKAVAWSGDYRFALEGHDGNNECIAEFPQEIWDRIKTETFYLKVEATDPQVRVTTGWWDPSWSVGDIQPGNERIVDNGDGTWTVTINISEDETFVAALDDRHLLFTGDRFTPVMLFFQEEQWVGGGDSGPKEVLVWTNELGKAVAWSGDYRFALEGHDGNNECIAEFPQDVWDKLKTQIFYLDVEATDPQVRVTTGWWDPSWSVGDIQPGNEHIADNGDGTWTVTINISEDETFLGALDDRHLLFTGDRYTPIKVYFME